MVDALLRRERGAVAFAMVFPTVLTLTYFVGLADASSTTQRVVYGAGKTIQFAFPLAWMFLVHRRGFRLGAAPGRGLTAGIGFGAAAVIGMLGLYRWILLPSGGLAPARGAIVAKLSGFGVESGWAYLALAAFYAILHSLLEEYYWRWFVFGRLRSMTASWVAVLLSSLAFMSHHVVILGWFFGLASPLPWILSACVFFGGAVWAWMYERSESLIPCWLGHLMADAAIFWIGYQLIR